MFELPNTLRFRLTGYFLGLFGLLQIALWIIVNLVVTANLYERFDAELLRRAQTFAQALQSDEARAMESFRDRVLTLAEPFQSENSFFEVRSIASGEVVKSSNMVGLALSDVNAPIVSSLVPQWRTLSGEAADALCGRGCQLRIVSLNLEEAGVSVQMGAGMTVLQRTLAAIRQVLIISAVVSLVAAGVASWIVAGRSLAPLQKIATRAKGLTAEHLEERLPAPTQGDEVADMIAAINEMLTRLERQFKNQQRFISNVSHELRTPLAVLMVEVQMQRKLTAQHPELAEFFESAEEEINRLLRMVESFLILTRARIRQRLETVADVSVEDVVVRAVQDAGKNARAREVRIVPHFSSEDVEGEPVVSGDSDLLVTAVQNLISNAVRHSPRGQSVEVDVHTTAKQVRIAVRDHGPGIPEEHHPHIFEMFYQVATRSGGGTAGIGLAIVKTVVELHGGTVSLRNVEGGGCEFTIVLPIVAKPKTRTLQLATQ